MRQTRLLLASFNCPPAGRLVAPRSGSGPGQQLEASGSKASAQRRRALSELRTRAAGAALPDRTCVAGEMACPSR